MLIPEHGTLVISLVWRDGIYLAADSRRGKIHNDAQKLIRLGPQTLIALRGSAMLDDAEKGETVLASSFLQDRLAGPITVDRIPPDADWRECDQARRETEHRAQRVIEPYIQAYAAAWNAGDLDPASIVVLEGGEEMLGVTIAQWDADGWVFEMDLEHRVQYDENRRIVIRPITARTHYFGPYTQDQIEPYWPPKCDKIIRLGPPQADDAPITFLERVFAAFIDASKDCAEDVGLPVDIAKAHNGVITPLVMKKAWSPSP